MSEEFRVSECSSKSLEEELNRLGSEGWLVINCWPTDPGRATIVMKLVKEYFSKEKGCFQACRPLSQLTLEVAAARCLKEPLSSKAKNHGLRLSILANEFGSDEAQVLERLRALGLETLPDVNWNPPKYIGTTSIALNQDKNTNWWLNAKEFPKKDSATPAATTGHQSKPARGAKPAPLGKGESADGSDAAASATAGRKSKSSRGAKPAPLGKDESADGAETAPPPNDFSVETAIGLCRQVPPRQEGWAHGIDLRTLAKHFGISVQAVLDGIIASGVPETGANYTPLHGHKLKLNKNKGQWWLNVR